MAEWQKIAGKVKSVNRANTGFTLEEDPERWLNYSKQGDAGKIPHDAARGDTVEVWINETGWIQKLSIVSKANPAPQGSGSGSGSSSGGGGSDWRARPAEESLSIGRQSALRSAVEFCGYLPQIEPSEEAIRERAKLVIIAATEFAKFVNEPIVRKMITGSPSGAPGSQTTTGPSSNGQASSSAPEQAPALPGGSSTVFCSQDGKPIGHAPWSGGEIWPPDKMVETSKAEFGEPLCQKHYLERRKAKAAEAAKEAGIQAGTG